MTTTPIDPLDVVDEQVRQVAVTVDAALGHLTEAAVAGSTARSQRAAAAAVETGLREEISELTNRLQVRTLERDEAVKRHVDHMAAAHPAPEPPKLKTVIGACPAKPVVGFNAKAAQGVVDRFGDGSAVRLFGGSIATASPRPAKAGHVHSSWDFGDNITARPTVAQLVKAGAPLKAGDGWERQHESDAKVRKGNYTLPQAHVALTDFAAKAKEARPDLLTVITFTGWLFSANKTAPGLAARNAWGPTAAEFDVTGIDLDGIHQWPYPDYRGKHIDNLLAFMDKFGIELFAVPELGWSRNVANDPTGTQRMDLLAATVERLMATGRCAWVDAYLYESTVGNDFNAAETARWRGVKATA